MGGSRSIRRPILLTILMWFCALYALSAVLGVVAVATEFAPPMMGGMEVSREVWFTVAAPVIGVIAVLMALTALGLRWHRTWARWTCMCIWPFIMIAGVVAALLELIPWWLARQALIDAPVAGLIAAWLLFWSQQSVLYFYRIRQARGGSFVR